MTEKATTFSELDRAVQGTVRFSYSSVVPI
jgi:hypothetical protein